MFDNLIKITCSSEESSRSVKEENSIILTAFEGNFVKVKEVKSEKLSHFLRDLEELNEKLETLLIELYKSGEGG